MDAHYILNPKSRLVSAYGPIVRNVTSEQLNNAHLYVMHSTDNALSEVHTHSDGRIEYHMFFSKIGYGKDVDLDNKSIAIRQIRVFDAHIKQQVQIIRHALNGVVDDEMADRIEALYRMNIPMSDIYQELLISHSVKGRMSEDGVLIVNSDTKYNIDELLKHEDAYFYDTDYNNDKKENFANTANCN